MCRWWQWFQPKKETNRIYWFCHSRLILLASTFFMMHSISHLQCCAGDFTSSRPCVFRVVYFFVFYISHIAIKIRFSSNKWIFANFFLSQNCEVLFIFCCYFRKLWSFISNTTTVQSNQKFSSSFECFTPFISLGMHWNGSTIKITLSVKNEWTRNRKTFPFKKQKKKVNDLRIRLIACHSSLVAHMERCVYIIHKLTQTIQ